MPMSAAYGPVAASPDTRQPAGAMSGSSQSHVIRLLKGYNAYRILRQVAAGEEGFRRRATHLTTEGRTTDKVYCSSRLDCRSPLHSFESGWQRGWHTPREQLRFRHIAPALRFGTHCIYSPPESVSTSYSVLRITAPTFFYATTKKYQVVHCRLGWCF